MIRKKVKKKIIIPIVCTTATLVAVAGLTRCSTSYESIEEVSINKSNQSEESIDGKNNNNESVIDNENKKEITNDNNSLGSSLENVNNTGRNEEIKLETSIDKSNAELFEENISSNENNSGIGGSNTESDGNNSNEGVEDNKPSESKVILKEFVVTKKYLNKKDSFNINLELNIEPKHIYAEIVTINDIEYPVTKVKSKNALSKNEKYTVELNAEDIAGIKNYEITQVKMSDGTKFNVTGNVSVEVKKDEAKANNFTFEDLGESDKLKVRFDLDDKDSSVTELRGVLYDS